MAYYDPITGEYVEGDDPNASTSPYKEIAKNAPDPKAGWPTVGPSGDPQRDQMYQILSRGFMERAAHLNKDPNVIIDEAIDKTGPGKMLLATVLQGIGSSLLNKPFKSVRESLLERVMEERKIQLQRQQNDSLRIQQLMQMDTRKEIAETQVGGRLAGIGMQEDARNFRQGRELTLKERELELKAEKLAQDYDLDWAKVSEQTRHNLMTEDTAIRDVLLKEKIQKFKEEHPAPPKGSELSKSQLGNLTLRLTDDYRSAMKPAVGAIQSVNRMLSSYETESETGVSDYNILYTYVRALDDMSTVREGEVEFLKQAQGIKQNFLNLIGGGKVNGKIFTDATVKDLIRQTVSMANSFRSSVQKERQAFLDLADEFGVSKTLLRDPFDDMKEAPTGGSGPIEYVKDPKTGMPVPKK